MEQQLITLDVGDAKQVRAAAAILAEDGPITLASGDRRIELPASVDAILRTLVRVLDERSEITVGSGERTITDEEAAEFLQMRTRDVRRLVDQGDLPGGGDPIVIPYSAVAAMKRRSDIAFAEFLDLNERLAEYESPLGPEYLATGGDQPVQRAV